MSRLLLSTAVSLMLTGAVGAAEPINIQSGKITLHGTLELPRRAGPVPVALIIAGSGPTDRDGNTPIVDGKNNSLKMLAEGLAARGIASLRYDKRGIGASSDASIKNEKVVFNDFIEDAAEWGRLLQKDKRFSSLIIIGHSEGALIGTVASRKLRAQGFISVAGAGFPVAELLTTQLRDKLPPDLLMESEKIISQLQQGKTVGTVSESLLPLFSPVLQPYMISWMRYDPAVELSKLLCPILIIQGTKDLQVSVENAERLKKTVPRANLFLAEGMNHVLKRVAEGDDPMKSYKDPHLPVVPEVIDRMADFIE